MLRLLGRVLAGLPAYLWSGWGAAASLLLLLATWEAVAALYDPLILPDPQTAFAALWAQVEQGAAGPALWATARARRRPAAPAPPTRQRRWAGRAG